MNKNKKVLLGIGIVIGIILIAYYGGLLVVYMGNPPQRYCYSGSVGTACTGSDNINGHKGYLWKFLPNTQSPTSSVFVFDEYGVVEFNNNGYGENDKVKVQLTQEFNHYWCAGYLYGCDGRFWVSDSGSITVKDTGVVVTANPTTTPYIAVTPVDTYYYPAVTNTPIGYYTTNYYRGIKYVQISSGYTVYLPNGNVNVYDTNSAVKIINDYMDRGITSNFVTPTPAPPIVTPVPLMTSSVNPTVLATLIPTPTPVQPQEDIISNEVIVFGLLILVGIGYLYYGRRK